MTLDPNRWTLKTQEAVAAAMAAARDRSNPEVTPDHLLAALLEQQDGIVLPLLSKAGLNPLSLRNQTADALAKLPSSYGGDEPRMNREFAQVLETADSLRAELDDEYLSTEHVLLALANGPENGDVSARIDIDREVLRDAITMVRGAHRVTFSRR